MESVFKIVAAGGLPLQLTFWVRFLYGVIGGALTLLRKMLELRNAWKTRPR
jgi:hypothetical protein